MVFALFLMPAAVAAIHAVATAKKSGAVDLLREGRVVANEATAILGPRLITEKEFDRMIATTNAAEVRAINTRAERRATAAGLTTARGRRWGS
jgi:hypothetical protein